jgi:hypothetical protein
MVVLSIASFLGSAGASWLGTWAPLCLMAVITTITFHAILVMAGRAFSIRELEAFAVSEIMQALATALIAIFLVVILTGSMELAKSYISGTIKCGGGALLINGTTTISQAGDTVMDSAYKAIRCTLQVRAKNVADIQKAMLSDGTLKTEFNLMNMAGSIFGVTIIRGDWIPSLYHDTETARIVNNLATVMLIGLNAQSSLLEYMRLNLLNIFLPVGVLLRSFYFTRGPGALFIAIAIGMYFMFPVFYVLLDPGFTPAPPDTGQNTPAPKPYCYNTMSTTVSMVNTMQQAGVGSSTTLTFSSMRDELTRTYIGLMLHPLVALFLTLVFVRYMMTILGGDSYELTKMVGKMI